MLRRFCGEWVEALDLGTLEPVGTELQGRDLRQRRADRVWRVGRRTGRGEGWVALEVQARPDPRMPYRIMEYQALLYGEMLRTGLGGRRGVAPVISVVLYNGRQRWVGPTNTAEALGVEDDRLRQMVAQVPYERVDVVRVPLGRLEGGDFATVLARLERAGTRKEFTESLRHTLEVLERRGLLGAELEEALVRWVCDELAARWGSEEEAAMLREVREIDEALSAIEERFKEWATEAQRAREEGKRQGLADSLLVVLRVRFGRVPRDVEGRIREADCGRLRRWLRRALKADFWTRCSRGASSRLAPRNDFARLPHTDALWCAIAKARFAAPWSAAVPPEATRRPTPEPVSGTSYSHLEAGTVV